MAGFGGFGRVIGGAMQGFGSALEKRATEERAAALDLLKQNNAESLREQGMGVEHGYNSQEIDQRGNSDRMNRTLSEDRADQRAATDHTNRMDEEGLRAKNSRSLEGMREGHEDSRVSNFTEDDQGNVIGFDAKGHKIDTGVKKGGYNKADTDLLNRVESQYSKEITERNEDGQPIGTSTQIDTKGAAQRLIDLGRPDLAKVYGGAPAPRVPVPQSGTNNFGSPSYDAGGGGAKPAAIPVPPRMANEPDGTVVAKGKTRYRKQGGQLIPL